jgi:hypothetical protein
MSSWTQNLFVEGQVSRMKEMFVAMGGYGEPNYKANISTLAAKNEASRPR